MATGVMTTDQHDPNEDSSNKNDNPKRLHPTGRGRWRAGRIVVRGILRLRHRDFSLYAQMSDAQTTAFCDGASIINTGDLSVFGQFGWIVQNPRSALS